MPICHFWMLFLILLGTVSAQGAGDDWRQWFSPELRSLQKRQATALQELESLGTPVVGQTAAQLGYQLPRRKSRPLTPVWIQVDLQQPRSIDFISLVPALVDWQSVDRPAFAFPLRFQVDISDDATFKSFVTVGAFTDEDFPNPGIAPVTINAGGQTGRFVRLTITKLAEENKQYFFALSEMIVLSGNINVALGCPVKASSSVNIPPRWAIDNLVDGRTPLGPPIRRELLEWDGLYAGPPAQTSENTFPWLQLDLGAVFELQEVRLHPIHARFGADIPGFSFPRNLRVEVSRTPDFADPAILIDSKDFSNPGSNPVTIQAGNVEARYIRVVSTETNSQGELRFGLSEIEAYSKGTNVAHGAAVTRMAENFGRSMNWPPSLLVDGFTSYGRIMELPDWLQGWKRRRELQLELIRIDQREQVLSELAQQRAVKAGVAAAVIAVAAGVIFLIMIRRRRDRELHDLRLRLALDIHDEIGSNLAGIAVLSEVVGETDSSNSLQREDWNEVNRIAHETLGAMREVLWLVGGREENGLDLMKHLQLAASRMLAGKEILWTLTSDQLPPDWPLESRRQVFLFFKEALANVVKHARATKVELSAHVSQGRFKLGIVDNGCGFDFKRAHRGMGLTSLQMRAHSLGGIVEILSAPGKGTRVFLEVPLTRGRRLVPFWSRYKFKKLNPTP